MNIPITKNLEEEYKSQLAKGFTFREALFLLLTIVIIAGVTLLLWWKTKLAPDICIYAGLPFGIPILFLGFRRIQGLTMEAYVKEIIYEKKTRILTYDADEIPGNNRVFTMERERKKNRRGWMK